MSTSAPAVDTVTVEIDRTFDATLDRIWQMFTDQEELAVWGLGEWYGHIAIDIDVRVGGVIHHRVTSKDDGSVWTFHGAYHEVVEKARLVYSFDWKTDWREPFDASMVAIDFSATADGRAAIHIEHSGVARPAAESTDTHWNAFLDTLVEHL